MENMISLLEKNLYIIVITLSLTLFISIIWNVVLTSHVAILSGKYKKFMRGTSGKNIEGVILAHLDSINSNDVKLEAINTRLGAVQEQLDRCIQKHSIVRYNAFNDTGSDLSYSIALMDNFDNGIAITGIYGRNEFIGYSKPIEGGNSSYLLSVEEQMAISRCQKKRVNNKE